MVCAMSAPENNFYASVTRRKFIYTATTALLAVGVVAALWPAIDFMNPDASAVPDQREVDLSSIKAGQGITVLWKSQPVFVRHRTADEVEKAKLTPLSDLIDRDARIMNTTASHLATDENRTKPGKAEWLVAIGVCSFESCVLKGQMPDDSRGDHGGWFCPCCASHYDTSGRTRKGPARLNLSIPPYQFITNTRVIIG